MVVLMNLLLISHLLLLQTPTHSASPFFLRVPSAGKITAVSRPQLKILHPPTSVCIFRKSLTDPLTLAACGKCDSWKYTPQKFLTITGTYFCLQGVGPGLPAKLGVGCTVSDSQWFVESEPVTKHLSTKLPDGTKVCLDVGDDNTIITNPCRSQISDADAGADDSQWFEITSVY
ncbi:hypothetical protein AXF42_Ash013585 [Apostasia shenzhenica]|uniref:Uncharacterized protein n=1 Tax=Apostasia shenzhenica TaxID=1088818 RepID=A0A2I0APB0_9ASPA|nr:hypothetical protein AXF42_Ash013585 [Apostasia shenzhenica]